MKTLTARCHFAVPAPQGGTHSWVLGRAPTLQEPPGDPQAVAEKLSNAKELQINKHIQQSSSLVTGEGPTELLSPSRQQGQQNGPSSEVLKATGPLHH